MMSGGAATGAGGGVAAISLVPHLVHISDKTVVGAPQAGQKLLPASGLAPQEGHISAVSTTSLPQFLQNIDRLLDYPDRPGSGRNPRLGTITG